MSSERKFRRTLITVEVLSEGEQVYDPDDLSEVYHDGLGGSCSVDWTITESEVIDGPTTAKALLNQSSDPEFFQLTEEGEDACR